MRSASWGASLQSSVSGEGKKYKKSDDCNGEVSELFGALGVSTIQVVGLIVLSVVCNFIGVSFPVCFSLLFSIPLDCSGVVSLTMITRWAGEGCD